MMRAVDSFGAHTPASAAALAKAAIVCAHRYHYNITRAEVDLLHAHGIAVCLIGEFDSSTWHPPLHNPETGAEHARKCVEVARRLGMPAGCVVWLTADVMIYPAQFAASARYWELAGPILRDAGYLVGAYGGSLFIDYLSQRGLADLTWQGAAASWNSADGRYQNAVDSKTAVMRQLVDQPTFGGVEVDMNTMTGSMVGAWMPDGAAAGGAAPATTTEDTMPRPIYQFPVGFPHPHAGTLLIDLRNGAYPAEGGWRYGPHWYHSNAVDEVDALARGHEIDRRDVRMLASGDNVLDELYGRWLHVMAAVDVRYPGGTTTVEPTPIDMDAVAAEMAKRLEH